jgi:hypothetical protein
MDHLEFPVSTLSTHRISYDLPRSSHVSDADFKFVMKHDKSKLTLQPHTYGARPVSFPIIFQPQMQHYLHVTILIHFPHYFF